MLSVAAVPELWLELAHPYMVNEVAAITATDFKYILFITTNFKKFNKFKSETNVFLGIVKLIKVYHVSF
ncbi:hypothetical protein AAE02nite_14080 [Adhaeribacter aerolatus]|uniref:Uncharacterized protein n=1 Tax=Adhaeribacter aerolatus TaxID=670289 RepID=A0A512AVL3_9BACT|nr:hypothetical protein AAE02nite_14080 [Adhaeribacter aerolatus]